ncbi:uncharacterized protein BCR38DRAFT_444299, partial [Pseudomassariella vexata]
MALLCGRIIISPVWLCVCVVLACRVIHIYRTPIYPLMELSKGPTNLTIPSWLVNDQISKQNAGDVDQLVVTKRLI